MTLPNTKHHNVEIFRLKLNEIYASISMINWRCKSTFRVLMRKLANKVTIIQHTKRIGIQFRPTTWTKN